MFKQKLKDRFHRMFIGNILEGYRIGKMHQRWLVKGEFGVVSHAIKQLAIKSFAQKFGIRVFIETGTYLGDMVAAVRNDFDRIFSIELSEDLFKHAEKKFAGYEHITIIHGDSSQVMPGILRHIHMPCLFWLDGHYSAGIAARREKETPIWKEMSYICEHPINNHVILIDDASLFVGKNDYPSIESMQRFVNNRLPGYIFNVQDDIIRIYK
jgi:hypothetical protein